MKLLGLKEAPPPDPDHKQAQFPHDLSIQTKQELGYQLGVWVAMLNFAAYQKALIEVDRDHYSGTIKRKVEDHLDAEKNRSITITEKKAAAHRSPEVRGLEEKREKSEAVLLLLQKFVEEFDRNYNAISREITRRASIPESSE
jgi:hypothetical protein